MRNLNYIFNKSYDIQFSVYNSDGLCIVCYDEQRGNYISYDTMKRLDETFYLDFESKEVSEYEPSICYGNKFYVKYSNDETEKYYLMAYVSGDCINTFSQGLLIVFIIVFIAVFIITAFIFSITAKNADKPVLEIEKITQKYAKGDFSERFSKTNNPEFNNIYGSLNKMADFIATYENTSKNFIANVSHELRTPITTIGGFIDGILDGVIPKSKHYQYLKIVSQEITRLRILISSMLNMTKFESGTMKPNFKETNVTELLIKTVFMFEQKIENKKVDIQGLDAERLIIVADSDLIEQVIYNLIENAVKFVNENGIISFDLRRNENDAFISIKNTGEGLKDSEISQVFDRFYKTDSSRGKDKTGLGIGLSISRKIVRLHNGQITVKSVHGEYTEFIIKLPVNQVAN